MTDKQYEWRGYAPTGISASDAGEALEKIEQRDGVIKAQAVVDEARPKDSVLHPAFEWRDKIAAEEHRKWQARQVIRSVRIVETNDAGEKESKPVYIHVKASAPKNDDAGYHTTARVMSDFDLFERAISEAQQKLMSAERSVSELKQLAEKTEQRDKMAAIGLVVASLQAATQALSTLH